MHSILLGYLTGCLLLFCSLLVLAFSVKRYWSTLWCFTDWILIQKFQLLHNFYELSVAFSIMCNFLRQMHVYLSFSHSFLVFPRVYIYSDCFSECVFLMRERAIQKGFFSHPLHHTAVIVVTSIVIMNGTINPHSKRSSRMLRFWNEIKWAFRVYERFRWSLVRVQ